MIVVRCRGDRMEARARYAPPASSRPRPGPPRAPTVPVAHTLPPRALSVRAPALPALPTLRLLLVCMADCHITHHHNTFTSHHHNACHIIVVWVGSLRLLLVCVHTHSPVLLSLSLSLSRSFFLSLSLSLSLYARASTHIHVIDT